MKLKNTMVYGHAPRSFMYRRISFLSDALKENGVIYTSFKYGDFEGERNGRYFTDLTEDSFTDLLRKVLNLSIEKFWITGDVRDGRGDERWLNVLMRKISKKM